MGIEDNINVIFTAKEIDDKIDELARLISSDYHGEELLLVGILKGSAVFLSDLLRKLSIPADFDFVAYSSYGDDTISAGKIKILKDIQQDVSGKHVLIVEDIVDTGLTLSVTGLVDKLVKNGAESVKLCTLLDKPSNRKIEIDIDYCGFRIDDYFVFGYGMDYKHKYRNLPNICCFNC